MLDMARKRLKEVLAIRVDGLLDLNVRVIQTNEQLHSEKKKKKKIFILKKK